jgi:o-succinylbenzoate synthase
VTLRLSQTATRRNLSRPAENAQQRWLTRDAAFITLESDDGNRGRGEAAPLPGFSRDTLADCQRAFGALELRDIPERLEPGQPLLAELGRASSRLPVAVPAARAALESALLDLWSRAAGVPGWAMLRGDIEPPRARRVAALLMGEPEQALAQALAARTRGVTTFKLKIGKSGALDRELSAIATLRGELGATADLRLDANRAWPAAVAHENLRRLAPFAPEFIEEPCAQADFSALSRGLVALALDESLAELDPDGASSSRIAAWGVRALILKPTLLGGICACAAWAQIARECGAQVILSHTFDGPLGLASSAALALHIGSEHAAHGLDLEGARLGHLQLPFFSESKIHPWPEPGLGAWEREP